MVNKEWTYKQSLYYISSIKEEYKGFMTSFCMFGNNKEYFEIMYNLKKDIYSLNFGEHDNWKRDKLWEYLNDDISYIDLWRFV